MSTLGEVDVDEHRWAEAESVLDRAPTEDARRRLRRRRTTTWTLIVSLLVLASACGVLLGVLLAAHPGGGDTSTAGSHDDLSLLIVIAGFVVEVVGVVLMVRAGSWGARWKAPTAVLTRSQRKHLSRQVLGKAPVEAHRLRLARDVAERTVRARQIYLLYVGLIITQVGEAVGAESAWRVCFAAGLVALFVATCAVFEVSVRRARRFLRAHPAPAPAPAPS